MLILLYFGAIAQLGERLHGMQEVVGSNPIGSIFTYLTVHIKLITAQMMYACCKESALLLSHLVVGQDWVAQFV